MNDNTDDNKDDRMDPYLSSVSTDVTVATQPDNSYFIPHSHRYYQHNNNNNNNNMNGNQSHFNNYTTNRTSSRHTYYQQHSNQFMTNNNQRIQPQRQPFTSYLAPNSMQNQYGNVIHNNYTTKDISCPGCRLGVNDAIKCLEYHPVPSKNKCDYGHAAKLDYKNGPKLFCDRGRKSTKGGGCTHPQCNRNHIFEGTNFHSVKCPREYGTGKCYLNNTGKCPYFHDGTIGINGQRKHDQGQSAYGYWPKSDDNDTDEKSNDISKSTKDLACIFRHCRNGNLCQYAHPNENNEDDEHKYYCQYGDGCKEIRNKGYCFNNHGYKWSTDKSPKKYVCQFWVKGGRGCSSDPDKCWMYHPNGKHSIDQ